MFMFRTVVIGTIALFFTLVVGPYIAVQFDFLGHPLPIGWFRLIGVVLMLFGAPFTAWCAYLLLIPGKGHPVPYNAPGGLLLEGPYKYVRNPFMLGWLAVLWGEVVFLGSAALLIYAVILIICVHFWVIAYEEPSLEDRYGEDYRRYKASVPRWIPKFKKH